MYLSCLTVSHGALACPLLSKLITEAKVLPSHCKVNLSLTYQGDIHDYEKSQKITFRFEIPKT